MSCSSRPEAHIVHIVLYITILSPRLQVGHVVRVALVQVVGGVGGGRGVRRGRGGRGAAAQRPLPLSRVRGRVCRGADHAVEGDLGGLPGAARASQGTLKCLQ